MEDKNVIELRKFFIEIRMKGYCYVSSLEYPYNSGNVLQNLEKEVEEELGNRSKYNQANIINYLQELGFYWQTCGENCDCKYLGISFDEVYNLSISIQPTLKGWCVAIYVSKLYN